MLDPNTGETESVASGADEMYGGDGYEWPYRARPRQWDHTLDAYPPGPGRPKGTRRADLSGETFGHLAVIERIEDHVTPSGKTHPRYRCQCACGRMVARLGTNLKSGKTLTCGCKSAELRAAWREEEKVIRREHNRKIDERYAAAWTEEAKAARRRRFLAAERSTNGLR